MSKYQQFRVGDVLLWKRASGTVVCEVLEIARHGNRDEQRACLKVSGWLGAHWEPLHSNARGPFELAERDNETVQAERVKTAVGSRATCNAFMRSNGLRFYGDAVGWKSAALRGTIAYVRGRYLAAVYSPRVALRLDPIALASVKL